MSQQVKIGKTYRQEQIESNNPVCNQFKFDGFSISKILSRLYLSGHNIATNHEILKKHHITHIVNATKNLENKFESEIVYKRVPLDDSVKQDLLSFLDDTCRFIDDALKSSKKNAVLVHCQSGVSRSVSIVIAYLLKQNIFSTYKEAYTYVFSCRSVIWPNEHFEKQLNAYQKILRKRKYSEWT
jgi:protein-tyrosine phosphatase